MLKRRRQQQQQQQVLWHLPGILLARLLPHSFLAAVERFLGQQRERETGSTRESCKDDASQHKYGKKGSWASWKTGKQSHQAMAIFVARL